MSLNKMRFKIIGLILLIGISIGFGGIVASDNRPPIGQAPPINDTTSPESIAASENEAPQKYTVTASRVETVNTSQLQKYGEVGTQAGERIEVTMSPTNVAAVENISWVTNVRPVIKSKSTNIPGSSDGESLGVQQAHQNGITGEGVKVGIIDIGFDINNPAIASNVADVKSYRSTQGSLAHGTSVAETVVRTAPDSEIYVVSISNTLVDTEKAIDYLNSQNVDVIVHSRSFAAIEDDGSHVLSDNINDAVNGGSLFVNSAGNEAQTHWEGDFRDTDGNDVHEWTDSGDELNCLPNCEREYSGEVTIFVRWNDQGQQSQYRPALYNPIREEYIKLGQDRVFSTPTGTQYSVLDTTVAPQAVDLVIAHTGGPADDEIEVSFLNGPQEIERNVPGSSISAPADVEKALAVAAYQRGISRGFEGQYPRQLASYSSRGPTDDGRTGIDVTGYTNIRTTSNFYDPTFAGTSAAAPYVGGVAALVHEKQPTDPSPTELTNTLKSSSDDILDPGIDTSSGSGVVNANEAIKNTESAQVQLRNAELSQNSISNNSESDRTLTFDALNVSSDGQQDNFTVTMPQSVELVAVTDVAVTNGNYNVSYSKNGNAIQFHVDPNRDVANVDLTFEADMTLTGRG